MNLELLKLYEFENKLRLGCDSDGGYVIGELCDTDSSPIDVYDCYISAGVSDEESFTRDFIQKYQMNEHNSFAFDGTICTYPYHYTTNISFIKKNIGNIHDSNVTNLFYFTKIYKDIFLKMDIEGGEYPWLLCLNQNQLNKFKQIVIEFHGITDDGWGSAITDKLACFEKLAKTHYIVHAHGNNHSPDVNGIPYVIELTYIRKDYFTDIPKLNTTPLPNPIVDFPNNRHCMDIDLNIYPFISC